MARASSFLDRINGLEGVTALFIRRVPEVVLTEDKWETLARLEPVHREHLESHGLPWETLWRAEQVHGCEVGEVPQPGAGPDRIVPGVDGLVTADPGVALGIYVADCAAVYLADRAGRAIGLVHSGKKGTEEGIVTEAVEKMREQFGVRPDELEAAVSPCIRPPHYEVDFVAEIEAQLARAGVPASQVAVSGVCTGEEVETHYSYRLEKGKTGRMLAVLGRCRAHV